MANLWKVDPTYTNYVARTAEEAVGRYVRCRNNGLKPMLIPECLIQCSRGLNEKELDRFEQWVVNPSGDLSEANLVPDNSIREANDKVFRENLERLTKKLADEKVDDDVKRQLDVPLATSPVLLGASER